MHPELQVSAFVAGALCYFGYFFRGEHHLHGAKYILAHTVAFSGLATLLYRLGFDLVEAVRQTCIYDAIFLAGLYSSLLVYRAFFNPLNVFPGPWTARITSFDLPLRIRKRQLYKTLEELHNQHGYFVRIGTSELSITHPNAIQEIFGGDSKCLKSPWYDISKPQDALLLRRSHAGHNELRRIYSPGFSTKAVRGYEERIQPYREKLIERLDARVGQTLDFEEWLGFYAWDIMGDLTFGHSFDMLDTNEQHWAIKVLNHGMTPIGDHLPMWFFRILYAIPGGQKDFGDMLKYTEKEMLARWKNEPKVPDIMSHLFEPYRKGKPFDKDAVNLLGGEAHLLMNAASDSTKATLTGAFFELAKHPEYVQKLREALAPHVSDGEIFHSQVSSIEFLDNVIWEALRMHSPTPSHPTRVTPAEGVVIAGQYVAGGTQVMAPSYVIGRDEKIFPKALEFIPERWSSLPHLVTDKRAIAPFSIGPYNCIGRPLAMMNVRITLARIIMRYDLSFAPDSAGADAQADFETGMIDHFTLQTGPLRLRLERRKQ